MKKVILKSLDIAGLRGQTFRIDFDPVRTIIRGANGSGKTTAFVALKWLLSGCDDEDRVNYKLYDDTKPMTHENACTISATGIFDIDGQELRLRRTASQKWHRPQGKAEYVKSDSDDYQFFVNDLAVGAKAYWLEVSQSIADLGHLKLMVDIGYYRRLEWKQLRKHFAEMVGEVDESDLKGDYTSIQGLLSEYKGDMEKIRAYLKQKINPLETEMDSLEDKIKGAKAILPSLEGVEEAERRILGNRSRIEEIDRAILGMHDEIKPLIAKREEQERAILAKKREIDAKRIEWEDEQNRPLELIRQQMRSIDAENAEIERRNRSRELEKARLEASLEASKSQLDFLNEEVERLREENRAIKAREFREDQTCQTCGQPLPADKVTELRHRFNKKRDEDHERAVARGRKMNERIAETEAAIKETESQISAIEPPQTPVSANDLGIKMMEVEDGFIPFDQSDIFSILKNQLDIMEATLVEVPEVDATSLIAEKAELNRCISEDLEITSVRRVRDEQTAKIAAMNDSQSTIGVELARLKGLEDACIRREREWASIVRERANKHLRQCKVEMVGFNKNGEMKDVCTVSIDDVDVSSTNTARKIVAGIDIAQAFQSNAGVSLPLFIDNAERITEDNLPEIGTQSILAIVDMRYPRLDVKRVSEQR